MDPPSSSRPNGGNDHFPSDEAAAASSSSDANDTIARLSAPWEYDELSPDCAECRKPFTNLNRRHHCRLCGKVFCHSCSSRRALVPPSSIVLTPKGGKKVTRKAVEARSAGTASFQPDDDPDRMLTYLRSPERPPGASSSSTEEGAGGAADTVLYGRGLEERYKLAREPLRVCDSCHAQLEGVQAELRATNSNAVRYNSVDPTDVRRLFNSPLAFTLGHEVRKAAYTLNNLLPLPRRMGTFVSTASTSVSADGTFSYDPYRTGGNAEQCRETCSTVSPSLGDLDGVRIPAKLMERARGVAVVTVVKGGFGIAGFEFGTGLAVARLSDGRGWSAPSAIGTAGVSWGALIGAQVSDHVFLLMTDAAVELMFSGDGSFQLGADVGVSVGPLGRSVEADLGASTNDESGGVSFAPVYTYSLSKGLYAGASLDGKVLVTRHRVNERFYGRTVTGRMLLDGEVPTPPAARPLYDALQRCHVYATGSAGGGGGGAGRRGGGGGAGTWGEAGGGGVNGFDPSSDGAAAVDSEYGIPPPSSSESESRRFFQPPPAGDR